MRAPDKEGLRELGSRAMKSVGSERARDPHRIGPVQQRESRSGRRRDREPRQRAVSRSQIPIPARSPPLIRRAGRDRVARTIPPPRRASRICSREPAESHTAEFGYMFGYMWQRQGPPGARWPSTFRCYAREISVTGLQGFEPQLSDPESDVLPLDDSPMSGPSILMPRAGCKRPRRASGRPAGR